MKSQEYASLKVEDACTTESSSVPTFADTHCQVHKPIPELIWQMMHENVRTNAEPYKSEITDNKEPTQEELLQVVPADCWWRRYRRSIRTSIYKVVTALFPCCCQSQQVCLRRCRSIWFYMGCFLLIAGLILFVLEAIYEEQVTQKKKILNEWNWPFFQEGGGELLGRVLGSISCLLVMDGYILWSRSMSKLGVLALTVTATVPWIYPYSLVAILPIILLLYLILTTICSILCLRTVPSMIVSGAHITLFLIISLWKLVPYIPAKIGIVTVFLTILLLTFLLWDSNSDASSNTVPMVIIHGNNEKTEKQPLLGDAVDGAPHVDETIL